MHLLDFRNKPTKNVLIQYQGGVTKKDPKMFFHDFKWNFFYFDDEGNFHDVFSSGPEGLRTEEDATTLLDGFRQETMPVKIFVNDNYYLPLQVYFYDLSTKSDLVEFFAECNKDDVTIVEKWFYKNFPDKLRHTVELDKTVKEYIAATEKGLKEDFLKLINKDPK